MIRKLSLAVAVATALSPLGALALGLGEIHPQSALNQTFKADIDLLSVTQEELQDVRVSLASHEAFKKAGMDRPFHLSSLKFTPQLTASGKPVITITSRDAIREPFLNFLVEVNWPKGRLVREFTVLLDPPVTLSRKPTPVAAPVAKGSPVVSKVMPSRRAAAPATSMPQSSMSSTGGREYGPVQPNDNLWNIAKQMQESDESIEQVMMSLLDHNPSAFINNNVNNLKVGKILRLPADAEVTGLSKRAAREEFLAQTREWKSGTRAAAPSRQEKAAEAPAPSAAPAPEDRLKLVSPKPGAGESAEREGQAESAEIEQLQQEIMLVRESNEGALQENSALKSRVQELEKQIQDIQRLLTLKSDQLAEVQAAQTMAAEKMQEMEPAAEAPMAEQPAEAVVPAEEMAAEEPVAMTEAEPTAPMEEAAEPVIPVPEGTVIEEVDIEAKIAEQQAKDQMAAPPAVSEPPAVAKAPESKPAMPEPDLAEPPVAKLPEKKVSYFDGLKENSTMVAIIGGAGVLLLGLLAMIMRRRKEAEAEFAESILVSPDSDIAPSGVDDSSSLTSPTDETSFMSDFSPSDIDALQDETGEVDPLSEADVYIAYGRYQQAEELINQAIEKYPEREELKHKLLEIYFSAKKSDAYTGLAQQLHDNGLEEQQPDAWSKIATMGKELNPGYALFAGAAGLAAADMADDMDDLGLDLGQLSEADVSTPAVEEAQAVAEDVSDELDSMDLSGLENLDEMDSETLEADLSLDSEFLNKMDGSESTPAMEDSDALDIDLSDLEVESVPAGIDSAPVAEETNEDPLPFDLSDVDDSEVIDGIDDQVEMEDSEVLDNLDLESIERELEGISSDLDNEESNDGDELSLLQSHSENLDLDSTDEITTKLDLARAYIDMGDNEGAKSILEEVVGEGSENQQKEAQDLLSNLSS
ncbi:MAG: FimV family protein [Candidatus Thiodiazotropha lotti]|uniref:FimV/HubP family polar landmark protein n=1 Tax=Candidatus Thiodiazotropha endoloripes TaxID=1818881 RepID=UPI00083E37C2|nr:FimV/HubP family polar landmark protein [Candidatus Thiodiazotropha endoloripes]MCG7897084.1 FimV family protein [Candidatus Thiodiazotropha weberae]MCG7991140.1 FimV family protein [Candidatus Thiodiazotropha lotti]MCG7902953.1 FimV family protein [Candidatus Thiodiazotropha weberae]MCG8001350.1 FimV family protein [Candidatus Thiodiazotropha lotti]MCW4182795.1 FimV family protein [Candidatus Thiodiazotropha weberae]